jgi:hypothetical protein
MKTPFAKLLGLSVIALALAACNSGGGSTSNPSTYPNCSFPGSFTAMYPENGANNIPDSLTTVYVASSVSLGSQYQTAVSLAGGSLQAGSGFTQVPLSSIPAPHAKAGFANPIYYKSQIGSLGPSSTWLVYFNETINCVPVQFTQFTTQ